MSIQSILRRLLLGPYAVIWMAILTQLLWHIYAGNFLDRWYAFCTHGLSFYLAVRQHPNASIAEVGSTALSALILSVAVVRTKGHFDLLSYMESYGCITHTQFHQGPGHDATFEVWTSGSKCQSQRKQMMTIAKALDGRMPLVGKEMCNRMCVLSLPPDHSRWHGYLTSAPAGHVPGTMYCNAQEWGKCVKDSTTSTNVEGGRQWTTVLQLYSSR